MKYLFLFKHLFICFKSSTQIRIRPSVYESNLKTEMENSKTEYSYLRFFQLIPNSYPCKWNCWHVKRGVTKTFLKTVLSTSRGVAVRKHVASLLSFNDKYGSNNDDSLLDIVTIIFEKFFKIQVKEDSVN